MIMFRAGMQPLSKAPQSTSSSVTTLSPAGAGVSVGNVVGKLFYAKALYDYTAHDADELALEEEDVVSTLSIEAQGGWLYGENHGAWGWFPANYIRFLTEEELVAEGLAEGTEASQETLESSSASTVLKRASTDSGKQAPEQTRSWFTKYKSIGRYEKKMSFNQSVSTFTGSGGDLVAAAAANHSASITITAPDVHRDSLGPGGNHVHDPTLVSNDAASPVEASSTGSLINFQQEGARPKRGTSILKKSQHHTSTGELRGSGVVSGSMVAVNTAANTSPPQQGPIPAALSSTSPSQITVNDSHAFTGNPAVSIVSGPASLKPRWVDHVGGQEVVDKLGLDKKEIQRQEVIHEFICTEKDYIDDLEIITEQFYKMLQKRQAENIVFKKIGDILCDISEFLKIYTMYCSNYPNAILKLQSVRQKNQLAKFLDSCAQSPECRNLNLANFLIKPVQRICKYPLLIKEILKHTDPSHPDFDQLDKGYKKFEVVVTIVNEGTRRAEAAEKMLQLQERLTPKFNLMGPSRELIKHGPISLVSANGEKKRRDLYLFTDMLLVTKTLGEEKVKMISMVPFDSILINSPSDQPGKEHVIEIVHVGSAKFLLGAESNHSKEMWMKALKEVTDTFINNRSCAVGGPPAVRVVSSAAGSQESPAVSPTGNDGTIEASQGEQENAVGQTNSTAPPKNGSVDHQVEASSDTKDAQHAEDGKTNAEVTSPKDLSVSTQDSISRQNSTRRPPSANSDGGRNSGAKSHVVTDLSTAPSESKQPNVASNTPLQSVQTAATLPSKPSSGKSSVSDLVAGSPKLQQTHDSKPSVVDKKGQTDRERENPGQDSFRAQNETSPQDSFRPSDNAAKDLSATVVTAGSESSLRGSPKTSTTERQNGVVRTSTKGDKPNVPPVVPKKVLGDSDQLSHSPSTVLPSSTSSVQRTTKDQESLVSFRAPPLPKKPAPKPPVSMVRQVPINSPTISPNTTVKLASPRQTVVGVEANSADMMNKGTVASPSTASKLEREKLIKSDVAGESETVRAMMLATNTTKRTSNRLASNPFIVQDMSFASSPTSTTTIATSRANPIHTRASTVDGASPRSNSNSDLANMFKRNGGTENATLPGANVTSTLSTAGGASCNRTTEERRQTAVSGVTTPPNAHQRSASHTPTSGAGSARPSLTGKDSKQIPAWMPQILPKAGNAIPAPPAPRLQSAGDSVAVGRSKLHPAIREKQESLGKEIPLQNVGIGSPSSNSTSSTTVHVSSRVRGYTTTSSTSPPIDEAKIPRSALHPSKPIAVDQISSDNSESTDTVDLRDDLRSLHSSFRSRPLSHSGSTNDDTLSGHGSRKGLSTAGHNAVNKPVKNASFLEVVRQTGGAARDYLLGHFPEEAGLRLKSFNNDSTTSTANGDAPKRIIPELPGQMMFVSEAVAKTRMSQLQEYARAILALPPKISRSPVVMNFFRVDGKNAITLMTGGGNSSESEMSSTTSSRSTSFTNGLNEVAVN
ncbi:Myosin 10A, isoform D [Quaeritorhiza haematococci]|nr:Myosin 10A, isoform D [Quaeritorhiza haematococci]